MNNQDALNELRAICKYCGGKDKDCSIDKPYLFGGACEFHFAAKALEKQIPKRPTIIDVRNELGKHIGEFYGCPVCQYGVKEYDQYCKVCGQAIDWSDGE